MIKKYIFIFALAISFTSYSQDDNPKIQLVLDQAIEAMNIGKYELAEQRFIEVIDNLKPLPSKVAYYFGKNAYLLGNHKQSINWLNKYIQLKGADSQFYAESKQYLALAEKAFLEANKAEITAINEDLGNDFECYSQDKMICPACKGSGVLIKKGAIENIYQTCPFSGGDGYLTCEEYNLYMRGELKPQNN